jgi:hypothetical protein
MRLSALVVLVAVIGGCGSARRDAPSSAPRQESTATAETVLSTPASLSATTPTTVASIPVVQACADDAVAVATTFVTAVQAGDTTLTRRCELPAAGPTPDRIETLRNWGLLLVDEAVITTASNADSVTVRIPSPNTPNIGEGGGTTVHMPDHQSGVLVTLVAPRGTDTSLRM